jgi:cell division protein FtsN
MSLRRIKHTFLRLTPEEKVSGLGALLVFVGIFLPWYSVVLNFDKKSITESGLSGDLGVLGFVVLLMVILALLVLVGEHLHIKLPQLGYTREQILFFLMGQSAFLVLLAIAVYTKRSLEFTDAELRFGIYLALIGAFLGAFAIFAQIQKFKKKEVHEFFEHDEEVEKETEKEIEEHVNEKIEEENGTAGDELAEEPEPEPEPEEDQMLFEQETETVVVKETMSEPEPEVEEEPEEEKIPEDEMIEEIEEVPQAEEEPDESDVETSHGASQEEEEEEDKKPDIQGDYFMREAGVEEDSEPEEKPEAEEESEEESEEKEEKEDKEKKDEGMSMGFYEDQ